MSWVGTLVAIVMIVLYVMTLTTEPRLTLEFSTAYVTSGKVFFEEGYYFFKGHPKEVNNTMEVGNEFG